ncbi:hypothetical protein [Pseudoalteromonas sp. GutCa3]|uniref:hypothetical protein n=1 Tax=Pseudoalteromonas sp. GutCa3 TaxID=888433 RepID=UPI000C327F73|nr:hypothetical protein [Pseudoalteromonas sp. GutCa3]PKG68640.1 hypothetical protein CXF64_20165 [Pseudoalteromonas sp. GutCa3]
MKLSVDLSELNLAASKMQGLIPYLSELCKCKKNYEAGLFLARDYVLTNGGKCENLINEETKLILGLDVATCFQLYPDIDLFYFEV